MEVDMINKMTPKYTYFIGIDVAAKELDYAITQGKQFIAHNKINNQTQDIIDLVEKLKQLPRFTLRRAVFCMEQTGIYCNHLLTVLTKLKANIVVEGALQIRNSLGNIRGKNDKMDAIRIADYAYRNKEHLQLWVVKRPILQQLAQLNTLRRRLQGIQHILKVPLKQQAGFVSVGILERNKTLCSKTGKALEKDVKQINTQIEKLISKDERLCNLMKIITSVPCVGPVSAINILLCTNEFKYFNNPKKFACYAGVAPFVKESGHRRGIARVSPLANRYMKSLLHICAVHAKRHVPELKTYFDYKVNVEKKNKMLVLNAIRYKLILRIFACVNQGRTYESTYLKGVSI